MGVKKWMGIKAFVRKEARKEGRKEGKKGGRGEGGREFANILARRDSFLLPFISQSESSLWVFVGVFYNVSI